MLKNSAPGSLQHVFSAESVFGILPLESVKSCEISSSAIPRPCTRDSRELIPIWELPMNLWIQIKQENMSTKFLNIYQTQYCRQSLHEVGKTV